MIETILIKYGLIPLLMFVGGWLLRKYVRDWLHSNSEREARAKEIAIIVSRIVAELQKAFPHATWDDILKMAVERIVKELGISEDIARREAIYWLELNMEPRVKKDAK